MRLECTKKLLDYLGLKPEKTEGTVDLLFAWTANLITINRRKTLVVVHTPSRCMFLIHGVTAKMISRIPELIRQGIRNLLESEYVCIEVIDRYLEDCGEIISFVPNSSRSAVAHCNKACERVKMFVNLFVAEDMFQQKLLPWLNDDLVGTKNYAFTHEMLIGCLRERYGDDIQSCCAAELEVDLKLFSPCKRRIIVPDNLNLYQLHRILQDSFEWQDRHLHQFVLKRDELGNATKVTHPADAEDSSEFYGAEIIDSQMLTVRNVFEQYSRVDYEYDFGDGWCHSIRLLRFNEDCREPYPRCIQAVGDAPMEDSGGACGFAEIMEILNESSHPQHEMISEWVRGSWWRPLNVNLINRRLKNTYRRSIPVYYE